MKKGEVDKSGARIVAVPSSPLGKNIKMGPVPSKRECRKLEEQIVDEIYSRIEEHGY